ncbi:MAG: hypothetical protein BGO25_17355 [Acidobacteriales bacterium 59-55]|nr:MAG: hypothetical protein BGO25_17355 [Acidobacteriales bacterium 59-55]
MRVYDLRSGGDELSLMFRSGLMRAMLGIEAGSRQAKSLHGTAMQKMLGNDLVHVFQLDEAVPDRLGIDDDHGAMLALVETAGLVGANQVLEARILHSVLEGGLKLFAALRQATGAGCVLVALVRTDKEVVLKFRHGSPSFRLLLLRLSVLMLLNRSVCGAQGFLRQL